MSRFEDEQRIVRDLGIMQLGKLRANKHKQNWRTETMDHLMACFESEIAELRAAVILGKRAHIALECADVANIVAMIADKISEESEDSPARCVG